VPGSAGLTTQFWGRTSNDALCEPRAPAGGQLQDTKTVACTKAKRRPAGSQLHDEWCRVAGLDLTRIDGIISRPTRLSPLTE
jgi:hypothetical protein